MEKWCSVLTVLFFVTYFTISTRTFKNWWCEIFNFRGTCPFCNDHFGWKKSDHFFFTPDRGILLCDECVTNIQNTEEPILAQKLREKKMDEEDVQEIISAIRAIKEVPTP